MTEATTVAEITNQKPATLLKAAEPKAIRGVVARCDQARLVKGE